LSVDPQRRPRLRPALRHTILSARDLAISVGPFVLLALLLLWGAYALLDPTPPQRVVLATGPENSAYAAFGERYRAELKRFQIDVVLKPSHGSADNLKWLRDPEQQIDLGFVQGGSGEGIFAVDEDRSGAQLVSLGRLFYEPVWLFYRDQPQRGAKRSTVAPLAHLNQIVGWRVGLGPPGSGVANLFNKLLHANRIAPESLQISYLAQSDAVAAFLDGKLDAVVLVSAPEAPLVQLLLLTPGVALFDLRQADAYVRRFAFLSALTLPRGVADLAQDLPPHDVRLVAPTTSLVAREGTHPALLQLFMQAAQRIHGETGWFARAREFPDPHSEEIPLAPEAARYYRDGPPLLQRYLPFWLANLIERMWVVLVSIIAVLIPLSRIVPPLYEFRVRSRIFRWYAQLRQIEDEVAAQKAERDALLHELDALEARVERITVPLSHADELYALRSHIDLVRARLRANASAV
jgi:ABC-type nitrate/sulfonate/bicarbonate transport system substrate-binding protein